MTTRKRSAPTSGGKPRKAARSVSDAAPPTPAITPGTEANFPVVGLGASAGGLEALEQFLRKMHTDSGMGFVIVQHLDPSHTSILTEILQRSTPIPVVEAQHQMAVAPNRVHVIPPNRDMAIFHGALQLSVPTEPRGQRMPIDAFLRSLAEDQGEYAIGIILSGTGTDGTLGLRAVFGAGGLCFVQEPATAKYDGMPTSAINAGYVTQVLAIDDMPQALRVGTRPLPVRQVLATPSLVATSSLNKILLLLRSATGHDFSQYKKSTIGRRIERRMAQHNIDDTDVYARYVKERPEEMRTLFKELLINVTSFFRDPLAFVVLKNEILPQMLTGKPESYVLRLWVAGCATGEEAYSIAIVLREVMATTQQDFKLQIYGTDLDDDAIDIARAGRYPPNIAQDVSPDRLRRFFLKENAGYRIKKEIRDMLVFAVQSAIKDPPFTRLDLLSCRNLLIYLEPELQNRLLPVFHYALKPGGVLFLSPSESVSGHTELFEPVDRKWKFYQAKPTTASTRAVLNSGLSWTADSGLAPSHQSSKAKAPHFAEFAKRCLLQAFAPASVVTDLQGNILYVHGETGKFLRPAPGQPTHNVVEMAREGLRPELRDAMRQAASNGLSTLNRELAVEANNAAPAVSLSVRLMPNVDATQSTLLVSFQELVGAAEPKPTRKPGRKFSAEARRVDVLEGELAHAKENMTAMLEEQQASNEELKSTNEELQSTNEELQSTNEELETSKEELQSVNEEMMTVNAELQTKIEQMASMQDDMKNLLDNMRVGTIFLDRALRIRRFTRDATDIYRLVLTDVGRPLADIRSELLGTDLLADAQAVFDSLVPIEREVRTAGGTWYLARLQPYRTVDNVIDGLVLTFVDVSERVQAIAMRKARDVAEAVIDTVRDPLVVLDGALQVLSANHSYYREFGGTPQDTEGQNLFAVGEHRWDSPALRELFEAVLPSDLNLERRMVEHEFPGIGGRRLALTARRIVQQAGESTLTLLSITMMPPDKPSPG